MSPHVKFYSGYLFNSDNKKSKMNVREKAQMIKCLNDFTGEATNTMYHLINIASNKLKGVVIGNDGET